MDWQEQLISLFLFVCKHYPSLAPYAERNSHYSDLSFSDPEVITLYLFGIIEGQHTVKLIHAYADKHLRSWFPKLPKYKTFDHRINRLHDVFVPLLNIICDSLGPNESQSIIGLTDAMPIIMAQRGRRFHAKVAPEIATKNGYCATKKLYYYGVKLHVVATKIPGALPIPVCIGLTDAGMHDRKAFEQIAPALPQNMQDCFADKAYQIEKKPIRLEGHTRLLTPVKKEKGQKYLGAAEQWLSTAVSQVRQPIESFFNWIHEKTGIQIASKVRSYQGLMVHVFGRLTAAMFIMKLKAC